MRRAYGFFGQVAVATGMTVASSALTSVTYSAGCYANEKYQSTKSNKSDSNQNETRNTHQADDYPLSYKLGQI